MRSWLLKTMTSSEPLISSRRFALDLYRQWQTLRIRWLNSMAMINITESTWHSFMEGLNEILWMCRWKKIWTRRTTCIKRPHVFSYTSFVVRDIFLFFWRPQHQSHSWLCQQFVLPSYSHSLPFVKGLSLNIIFYVWLPDKDKQLASSESKTKTDLQKHDEEDLQELLIRAEQLKGSSPTHLPVYFNYFFISFCISRLTLRQFWGLSDSFIESSQRSYTHMSLP